MDQSSRDDTLVDVGPPGATPAGAVSSQSSRDKHAKRSAGGSSMDGEGRAISMQSLQLRSVVAAAVSILLALVVVGVGVDLLASRHLHRSLDHTLRERAVEVAQLSASAPALLTTPGALDSPLGGTQLTVEVLDRRGRIVARSLSLGGRIIPAGQLVRRAIAGGTG